MAKETKMTTSSVNLPVDTIDTIINIDDRRVEVPITEVVASMNEKEIEFIRSDNTIVHLPEEYENQNYVKPEFIEIQHNYSYINSIEKRKIGETNSLKFFKMDVEFSTGRKKTFIVPSYVKFYSCHKGSFIPVEHLKSRDILVDYSFNYIKVDDTVEATDYKMPENYYNIKVAYDEEDGLNFYLNGILANVSYNNFNKTAAPTTVTEDTNKEETK